MKKVLSIILAAAMLMAMVPAMLVGVSAEAATASAVSPTAEATSIGNTFPTFSGKNYEAVNVNEVIDAGRNWVAQAQSNPNGCEITWKEVWDTDFDNKNWTMADTGSSNDSYASAYVLKNKEGYSLTVSTTGKMERAAKLDGVVIHSYKETRAAAPQIELSKDNVNWDVAVQTAEVVNTGLSADAYIYFEFPAEYKSEEYQYVRLTLNNTVENEIYQIYEVVLLSNTAFTSGTSIPFPTDDDVYGVVDVNDVISSTKNKNVDGEILNWNEIWDTAYDDKEWNRDENGITDGTTSANNSYASMWKIQKDGPDGLNISTTGKMERTARLRGIAIKTHRNDSTGDRIGAPIVELSKDNVNWDVAVNVVKSITTSYSGDWYAYFEFPEEYQNEEYEYVKISIRDVKENGVYQIYEAVLLGHVATTVLADGKGVNSATALPQGSNLTNIPVLPYSSTSNKSSYVSDREIEWNEVWDTDVDQKELYKKDTLSSGDDFASARLLTGGTNGLEIETVGIMETVSSVKAIMIQTGEHRAWGISISLSKDNVNYDEVIFLDKTYYNTTGSKYPYLYCEIPEKYADNEYKYVRMSIDGAASSVYEILQIIVYTESETFEEGVTNVYAGVQSKTYAHDTKGDCYAVRFVQTVDESVLTDYVKAGFEISADYGAATPKDCSKETNYVYTSIIAAGETLDAASLKRDTGTYTHEYIVALSVIDIQKDVYDDVIFTVKPYIEDAEGVRTYAGEYTVIFDDGVNMSVYKGA